MKKLFPWVLVVLAVAGIAFGAWKYQKAHATPDVGWKTATIEKKRIAARITASGTLQATVTVQVGAQVSGRIQKLNADYNSTVKKGQLLAKMDPQLFAAALEQANANFLSGKAGVVRAEAQEKDAQLVLARAQKLGAEGLAAASEVQTAETNVAVTKAATEVAKAALAQATAARNQAQVNLSYTDIFSPIDGTVISRSVDVGQTVAASLQAPVLFTIAEDLKRMQVHTNVAEGDVGRLQEGMHARFTVDAFAGQSFFGKVNSIRNAAQTVQNVVTYDAVIDVENPDLKLRPGMTATVTVAYAEREDAIAVPNAAFRFKPPPEIASIVPAPDSAALAPSARPSGSFAGAPPGDAPAGAAPPTRRNRPPRGGPEGNEKRTVYVMRGANPEPIVVTAGLSDGTVSEVLTGDLKPGDQVVVDVTIGGKAVGSAAAPGGPPRMGRMF